MTNEELQAIEERANAATPAPWTTSYSTVYCNRPWPDVMGNVWNEADAAFIAAARADVPALVAEVRRLQDDARRLEHYQQFVVQISEALGVPDDSMILPYAQEMAAEITRLRAELAAVPVDTIRAISLTEAKRLNEIDWTPIAAWFDAMDGAKLPTSGFFTSGRWNFSEA